MYGVRTFRNLSRPSRLALPLAAGAAGLALAALLPSAAGAAVTPAATIKVKVDGLNRAGKVVSVQPSLINVTSGYTYFSAGGAVRLPAGTYLVGGSVPTYNSSRQAVSQTLVVRRVTITRSETVRLNGEHGKLVRVGLAVSGAAQQSLTVMACLAPSSGSEIAASASGGQGVAVYAVPSRHGGVMFTYMSDWQSPSAQYQLSGNRHDGIPSVLSFRPRLSSLAKIDFVLRANETPPGNLLVQADPNGGNTVCQSGAGLYSNVSAPSATTVYRTPGSWLTSIGVERGSRGTGYIYRTRTYRAGHSYADRFLTAGYGPRDIIPAMEGDLFNADVSDLFADPVARGDNCCDKSVVTLRQGSHLIKKQDRSEWREHNAFNVTLHKRGWYTLSISSRKWSPYGSERRPAVQPGDPGAAVLRGAGPAERRLQAVRSDQHALPAPRPEHREQRRARRPHHRRHPRTARRDREAAGRRGAGVRERRQDLAPAAPDPRRRRLAGRHHRPRRRLRVAAQHRDQRQGRFHRGDDLPRLRDLLARLAGQDLG